MCTIATTTTVRQRKVFAANEFIVAADQSHAICPAGERLHRNGKSGVIGSYHAVKFTAPISTCQGCTLRDQCLRKPATTRNRQVALLTRKPQVSRSDRIRERIDSAAGCAKYGQRLGVIEPVFGTTKDWIDLPCVDNPKSTVTGSCSPWSTTSRSWQSIGRRHEKRLTAPSCFSL